MHAFKSSILTFYIRRVRPLSHYFLWGIPRLEKRFSLQGAVIGSENSPNLKIAILALLAISTFKPSGLQKRRESDNMLTNFVIMLLPSTLKTELVMPT